MRNDYRHMTDLQGWDWTGIFGMFLFLCWGCWLVYRQIKGDKPVDKKSQKQ